MVRVKAVVFDYIGTVVNCVGYSMDVSKLKLYRALVDEGVEVSVEVFLETYSRAHEKYRGVRYGELREVTNAVWVAEALNDVGYSVAIDDVCVKAALDVFFKDFMDSLRLRTGVVEFLEQASSNVKVGLLSNFTYAPVVYLSLDQLGVSKYFNGIVVSEEYGWRKPSPYIFREVLERLQVEANEVLYIGDSPIEDIKGAKDMGFRTLFVKSQFYSLQNLAECGIAPEFAVKNLREALRVFSQISK
ncbi:MAG: HAD family hydrolase [Nitrososphaerota archaeon]|nr:HAD family hydrolase [Nitrososphaerota archaeon]